MTHQKEIERVVEGTKKAMYEELEEFVARRRRLNIPVTVNRLLEHMQSMYIRPLTHINTMKNEVMNKTQ